MESNRIITDIHHVCLYNERAREFAFTHQRCGVQPLGCSKDFCDCNFYSTNKLVVIYPIVIVNFKPKVDWFVKLVFNMEVLHPFRIKVVVDGFCFADKLPFCGLFVSLIETAERIRLTEMIQIS